jgi:hypothetical protein
MKDRPKALATKTTTQTIWYDSTWTVRAGQLKPGRGRPRNAKPLFKAVGEKIPFGALDKVRHHLAAEKIRPTGIYVAHDSMGVARYIGRGNIFQRLKARRKAQQLELQYFSFFVGLDKNHEREIETVLIRSVGPALYFNTRKKREDIQPGNVRDYEAGTRFVERQYKRGRKSKGRQRGA